MKNRIAYLCLLIFVLYVSMIFREYGLFVVAVLTILLPFFSLLYSLLLRRRVLYSWGDAESVVRRGGAADIAVAIRNNSLLPTGRVELQLTITDVSVGTVTRSKKTYAIAGRSVQTDRLSVPMTHSGILRVSIDSVRVQEPLGLFSHTSRAKLPEATYLVLPEIVPIAVSPLRHNPYAYIADEIYSTTKPGDDPSELFGTREYIPGDRQNRIHWSLTAKQDKLMVKELGLPVECSALILLDMFRTNDAGKVNALFDTAFSLSAKLAEEHHRHWFAWYDAEHGEALRAPVESVEDVYSVIAEVFRNNFYSEGASVVPSYFAAYDREQYRNIFYVSGKMLPENRTKLQSSRTDAYVVCYTVDANETETGDGEWRELAVRSGEVAADLSGEGGTK